MAVDRRTFLKGGTAAVAGVALGGPFQGFLAHAAGPGVGHKIDPPPIAPTPDLRGGVNRLGLPPGFSYRTFDVAGDAMVGGTIPSNHDGMAAFPGAVATSC